MVGDRDENERARSVEITSTVRVERHEPQRIAYYPNPVAAILAPLVVIGFFAALEIFLPPDNMPLWLRIPAWLNVIWLAIAARSWVFDPTLFQSFDKGRPKDGDDAFNKWVGTTITLVFGLLCIYGAVTLRLDAWYRMPILLVLGGIALFESWQLWINHQIWPNQDTGIEQQTSLHQLGLVWTALTITVLVSWGIQTRKPTFQYVSGIGTTRPSAITTALSLFPPNSTYRKEILSHIRFVRTDVSTLACFEHPSTVYFELAYLAKDGKSGKAALALLMYGGALAAQGVPLPEINIKVENCRKELFDKSVQSSQFSPDTISVTNSKGAKYIATEQFKGPTGRGGYYFNYELRY